MTLLDDELKTALLSPTEVNTQQDAMSIALGAMVTSVASLSPGPDREAMHKATILMTELYDELYPDTPLVTDLIRTLVNLLA